MRIKKAIYIILGCISLGFGAVGAVLPLLPSFPFLLLSAFCFARSSDRLYRWFTGTKLYKNNLETYVNGQGMTRKTKIRIMVTVTLLMSVGFFMMHRVPQGQAVLVCVWVFHLIYFTFRVKTYNSSLARNDCTDYNNQEHNRNIKR
ncbi:MAG: YbaN family protein [Schaedlerella sp.]|nr:YbaN family protein [Lachnospiraceae bacterium]MDY4201490.1 YbaN family protein [Schaedlerella sp.]